jgi:FKBP-type peptidyl-prolyl cis-trans isomerase
VLNDSKKSILKLLNTQVMKTYFFSILFFIIIGCEKKININTSTNEEKAIYTLGQMYAQRINYLNLSKEEFKILSSGIYDELFDSKAPSKSLVSRQEVQNFIDKRTIITAELEKRKGKEYIKKYLKEDGARVTDSGLAYKILKPGNKERASLNDDVLVHYHGTFINGEVFDSSIDSKEKAILPMKSIIKGWQEALRLIGEDGKIQFVLPSDLAYGDTGSPPQIPGGATLLFELTLYKIIRQ